MSEPLPDFVVAARAAKRHMADKPVGTRLLLGLGSDGQQSALQADLPATRAALAKRYGRVVALTRTVEGLVVDLGDSRALAHGQAIGQAKIAKQ